MPDERHRIDSVAPKVAVREAMPAEMLGHGLMACKAVAGRVVGGSRGSPGTVSGFVMDFGKWLALGESCGLEPAKANQR